MFHWLDHYIDGHDVVRDVLFDLSHSHHIANTTSMHIWDIASTWK